MGAGGTIHNVPDEVKAKWPELNSVDPIRRTWLPQYAISLQAIAIVIIAVRLWSRFKHVSGGLGIDDALITAALIFGILLTTLLVLGVTGYSYDRHVWDMPEEQYVGCALVGWLAEGDFLLSTSLTKLSVLVFYRRLSSGTQSRIWQWTIYAAIIFIVAYTVILILIHVFTCSPPDSYWKSIDPDFKGDFHCSNEKILYPAAGALSVFTDFYSVLLPAILLWNLRIPRKKKIALRCIIALGFLIVAIGIVRTVYFALLATASNADSTWNGFNVMVWAQAECQLAMICASAPSLTGLYTKYLGPRIRKQKRKLYWNRGKTLGDCFNFSVNSRLLVRLSKHTNTIPLGQRSHDHLVQHVATEIPGWVSPPGDSPKRPTRPPVAMTLEGWNYGPPVPQKTWMVEDVAWRHSRDTIETAQNMV